MHDRTGPRNRSAIALKRQRLLLVPWVGCRGGREGEVPRQQQGQADKGARVPFRWLLLGDRGEGDVEGRRGGRRRRGEGEGRARSEGKLSIRWLILFKTSKCGLVPTLDRGNVWCPRVSRWATSQAKSVCGRQRGKMVGDRTHVSSLGTCLQGECRDRPSPNEISSVAFP